MGLANISQLRIISIRINRILFCFKRRNYKRFRITNSRKCLRGRCALNQKQLINELKELRSQMVGCLTEAEAYHALELKSAEEEAKHSLGGIEQAAQAETAQIEASYRQESDEIARTHQEQTKLADDTLHNAQTRIQDRLRDLQQGWGLLAAPWDEQIWKAYGPDTAAKPPKVFRVGTLNQKKLADNYATLAVPAMVRLTGKTQHLVFLVRGAAKQTALEAMESVCLRLLATFAPGDLQFTFIDPVGLGNNVAGFMKLSEALRGAKAWTETDQIRRQMEDLTAHMEMVFQKYLTNEYKTIDDYNAKAGLVAEPYRFLVVANFPVNFTEDTANRLLSIASNGPRTGVHIIAVVDSEQIGGNRLREFDLNDLLRTATVIEMNDKDEWQIRELNQLMPKTSSDRIRGYSLVLDKLPAVKLMNEGIIQPINQHADRIRDRVRVEFAEISSEQPWRDQTQKGLTAPIGRLGAQDVLRFDLGKAAAQHALVAGKTGMGKSNLLHVIVTSLAWMYSPEELELYLIDGKAGVEFKDYADYRLPHARVIAIQSEREFGLSVLRGLDVEMKRRADEVIKGYQDLPNYRAKTGGKLPRILLVIDEFQDIFSDDDSLAIEAAQIVARLVQQGRGFGIHVLMASQSLASARVLNRVTYDQMGVRIALQCSEDDSTLILGTNNIAARALTRVGEAIYNAANGLLEGNVAFQVARLSEEPRRDRITELRRRADESGWKGRTIVFEGNAPSHMDDNDDFTSILNAPEWAITSGRGTPRLWLGEPMELKAHIAARIRRQSAVNLMILGQDERMAFALLTAALLSLCAQHKPETASFYLVNLAEQSWTENFPAFQSHMPHTIRLLSGRNLGDRIIELAGTVKERLEKLHDSDQSALDGSIYLVIGGLQLARDLRRTDEYSLSPQQEALSQVLRDGPEIGVHTLLWSNSYANAEQVLSARDLNQFCLKVAMQMSQEDSRRFINESLAANLGLYRAYFVDEDAGGKLEKFRPYGLLESTKIEAWGEALKKKGANDAHQSS
jgi:S-DNA-T family DNA segregation ATPase FtsK/SpoIIIE